MLNRFSLEGRVAIVTGGGTGIGRAISLLFAKAGADVVLAGRRLEPIMQTAEEVRRLGRRSLAVKTDVTDSAQVDRLVEATISTFGALDILVNNAGIARGIEPSPHDKQPLPTREIWEWTDDMWQKGIETNLSSVFYCCRSVARHMAERKKGKIINISSAAGVRAAKGLYTYSTAKAAVIMLTKVLAVSLAKYNIQVNCIAPGNIEVAEEKGSIESYQIPFIPMGRLGKPEEVGVLAVLLASSASDYITGECFFVDGARFAGVLPIGCELKPWGSCEAL